MQKGTTLTTKSCCFVLRGTVVLINKLTNELLIKKEAL